MLVLSFALRGFSPGTSVFPSPQKPTVPNSSSTMNHADREPPSGSATSTSLSSLSSDVKRFKYNKASKKSTQNFTSFYTEENPLKTLCKVLSLSFFNNAYSYKREIWLHNFFFLKQALVRYHLQEQDFPMLPVFPNYFFLSHRKRFFRRTNGSFAQDLFK